MKWYRVIILLSVGFLFSSCALFKPSKELKITPAVKANEIRNLLSTLQAQNNTLKNFKGIGKIKLWQNGIIQTISMIESTPHPNGILLEHPEPGSGLSRTHYSC